MVPISLADGLQWNPRLRAYFVLSGLPELRQEDNLACWLRLPPIREGPRSWVCNSLKRRSLRSGLGGGSSDAAAVLLAVSGFKGRNKLTLFISWKRRPG